MVVKKEPLRVPAPLKGLDGLDEGKKPRRTENDQEMGPPTEHLTTMKIERIQNNVEEEITGKYNLRKREKNFAPERF
ncbi:hypothetical protein JTB14_019196 [Gonioctena quinquepunctata]|nr:hypothetical protein JTB14_019196 [Gonioctena quinquepunctata]